MFTTVIEKLITDIIAIELYTSSVIAIEDKGFLYTESKKLEVINVR